LKFYLQAKASLKAGGYYSYSSKVLNDTPIPKAEKINQTNLEELSLEIIIVKKQNPSADTTDLENQIDHLVYQLYGLTKEEIQIIESKS
jgi:adenine-specific DNA-methyltransferase